MPHLATPSAAAARAGVLYALFLAMSIGELWAGDSGLPNRPHTTPYLAMPSAPPIPNGAFTAAVAFPNLTFQGAVAVRAVPGTNRLWVLEREGRIWSFEDDPATTTKTLVLDLNDDDLDPNNDPAPSASQPVPANDGHLTNGVRWWCQGWDDCGLMGLAFHPDFADPASLNRGQFFVCYQARNQPPAVGIGPVFRPDNQSGLNDISGCYNRLSRFTVPASSLQADPASEVILVDQPDRHLWHNGGDLLFGNDGFLYLLNGDEGRANDWYEKTQRVGSAFFGGVWRIDVDGPRTGISKAITHHPRKRNPDDVAELAPFTGNYGIPLDNPWVGLNGVLEEFWSIGLRSPHRMTIDPPTGRIFVGDIGQAAREEVDLIVKGGNYQWAYKEGHKNNRSDRQPPDYTVASLTASGNSLIPVTNTAVITGNGLSPGLIKVGDRVRFTNHATLYQVTTVVGYPHSSLTITPELTDDVPVGTTIRRTSGFSVVAVTSSSTGNDQPNNYGSSQLTITGSGLLPIGSVISFLGTSGSHQVIAASGAPNTTTITIIPGFAASPSVTAPVAGTRLDHLTVFGTEQPPYMDFSRNGTFAFNSIIGGYVYRGSQHPVLTGKYLLANNSSGKVYAIDQSTTTPSIELLFTLNNYHGGYRGLGGFGLDHDGEPLLCVMQAAGQPTNTSTGQIWKITRANTTVIGPPIPTDLAATGAFVTDGDGTLSSLTPATSLIPYEVNAPLWSDAAHKRRWIAVPDGATVGFSPIGEWTFPVGTVFVKHFELTVNEQTNQRRRLETRLLVRSPGDGVYGVTYQWNDSGTQATLVSDAGVNETYTITAADGVTTRTQTWNYPSRNDCLSCHNANAGYVLGVNTRQLNGNCTYPSTGITDHQLNTWSHIGLFDAPPLTSDIPKLTKLAHLADVDSSPEKRVRSWLDTNCSHCHRPGGVHANFDARFDTPLRQQQIVNGDPLIDLHLNDGRIIARGSVSHSIMHLRDNSLDSGIKMPPLGKNLIDTQAISVMETWINSLPYTANPTISGLVRTYDGQPKAVTVNAETDGVPTIEVIYEGISVSYPATSTPPTNIGTYQVRASLNSDDLLYHGSTNATLEIIPPPVVTVADVLHPEGNSGNSQATALATLSGASTSPITLDWSAMAGSATASTDFTLASGTLTFAPGVLSQPITIVIAGDVALEANETVIITLSNGSGVVIGTTTAIVTIANDDANNAPVIAEGTSVAVACDEDLAPTAFALSLHASDVDAGQAFMWSVVVPPTHGGVGPLGTSATQVIAYDPDPNYNGSDTFTVRVADGAGGHANCVVTVNLAPRNDPPVITSAPLVTIGSGTASATTGTWSDSLDLTPGAINTAIQWQHADDALGTNVSDVNGAITANRTLTAADSGRFLRVRVTANDDGEGQPVVATAVAYSAFVLAPYVAPSVTMTSPITGILGAPASVTWAATANDSDGVITLVELLRDDVVVVSDTDHPYGGTDGPHLPGIYVYRVRATDSQGLTTTSAPAIVTVEKSTALVRLERLTQTVDGFAKPVTVTTTPAGLTTRVTYDGNETAPSAVGSYAVEATINDPNYLGSASDTLVITTQPVLSLADVSVTEGSSLTHNVTLTAQLSLSSTSAVSVSWAAGAGSATAASDFIAASGTLTFAPGEKSQTILVPIIGDTLFEGDETIIVTVSDPQQLLLDTTSAVITILNDDTNSAPLIAEGTSVAVACDEDHAPTAFALTLHASDVDVGQALTWSMVVAPTHGDVGPLGTNATQVIAYDPNPNYHGSDTFTVRVADEAGGQTDCVIIVTVAPRNDPPVMTDDPVVTIVSGNATATLGMWLDNTDLTPGTITTAIQWQRADDAQGTNLSDVAGAITTNHTLTTADAGRFLRVRVTASDDGEGQPAIATSVAHSAFVAIPAPTGSSNTTSPSGAGGGCGLGSGITGLLGFALLLLRRLRLR